MSAAVSSALKKFDDKFQQKTGWRPSREFSSVYEGCARVGVAAIAVRIAYQGAKEIENEGLSFQAAVKVTAGTAVTLALALFPIARLPERQLPPQEVKKDQ